MLVLAVPVGVAVGLSLGALGGGGSILTVPALVYLLGTGTHAATAASLVIVGTSAAVGAAAHARAGRVRVGSGLAFGAIGVAGSFAGSRLSAGIEPDVLLAAFAGLLLVAAGAMARRVRRGGGAGAVERSAGRPRPVRVVLAASGVGLLTGFFGVGGGFVVVPALVLALGLAMPVAVGTSLLVIAVNSAAALASRIGTPVHLDLALVAVFSASAALGSLAGNRVATRVRPERLAAAFTVLLVVVAVYTASRSAAHLV